MLFDSINENAENPWALPVLEEQFQAGDIVYFWGNDWLSWLIWLVTWGPTHVGIIVDFRWRPDRDSPDKLVTRRLLVESTTMLHGRPCVLLGVEVAGVQAQEILPRIRDYTENGGRVELWRFKRPWKPEQLEDLSRFAFEMLGRPYDYRQAGRSGTWWIKHILARLGIGASDDARLFCSETTETLLRDVGKITCARNPSQVTPAGQLSWLKWVGLVRLAGKWTAA